MDSQQLIAFVKEVAELAIVLERFLLLADRLYPGLKLKERFQWPPTSLGH